MNWENIIRYGTYVGTYTLEDLKDKKDKKDLERLQQFYHYTSIQSKIVKENGIDKLVVYVF